MKETDIERLHIVGKADNSIIKKVPDLKKLSSREIWLFVGYCFHEFTINSVLDIIIDESTQNWDHDSKMKLTSIYDEYGRRHDVMPVGYKTICSFECTPVIPSLIKSLHALKTWEFNKKGVYLCNHNSIKLTFTPAENYYLFEAFSNMFFHELQKKNKSFFSIDELEHYLPKNITPFIIDNLLLSGKIKQGKKKDELVLTDQD